jgi:hypothetical protein
VITEAESEPIFELAQEPDQRAEAATPMTEMVEPTPEPATQPPVVQPAHPASPASVEEAIEEVSGIIDALRGALEDMEEVLEMLEVFERQKNADEREIDSLKRALRQMHRPRETGHHSHR